MFYLYCHICEGEYSAAPGDYFWKASNEPFICCGENMVLVESGGRFNGDHILMHGNVTPADIEAINSAVADSVWQEESNMKKEESNMKKIVLEIKVNSVYSDDVNTVLRATVEALEAMFSVTWVDVVLSSRIEGCDPTCEDIEAMKGALV